MKTRSVISAVAALMCFTNLAHANCAGYSSNTLENHLQTQSTKKERFIKVEFTFRNNCQRAVSFTAVLECDGVIRKVTAFVKRGKESVLTTSLISPGAGICNTSGEYTEH